MDFPRLQVLRPDGTPLGEAQCAVLARARKYGQYCRAVMNAFEGKCPFCDSGFDPSYNVVEFENEHWRAWPSRPPEDNTALHFIIAPKRHVEGLSELDDATEGLALLQIRRQVNERYSIASSGVLIRDGDATLSAGTIQHLHVHVMVPNGTGRVESPFFKGAESEAESHRRAIVFERLRLASVSVETLLTGMQPEMLSDAEFALLKNRIK